MDTQNSQADLLFKVATGLFKDARLAYSDYDGILLDLERFARIAKTRGLGFYTLDLPRFDELLVRGLETGVLDPTFGYKRRRKGSKVPLMLEGLWRRVFCDDGRLCDEPDSTAIAFLRQIFCLGKKVETECSQQRLDAVVKEYYAIERDLRHPTADWQSDDLDFDALRDVHFRDGLDHHSAPLFDRETPESCRDADSRSSWSDSTRFVGSSPPPSVTSTPTPLPATGSQRTEGSRTSTAQELYPT